MVFALVWRPEHSVTDMSTKLNDEWLQGAWENFRDALEGGDIKLAKCIVADVQERGFIDEGRKLNVEMREYLDKSDDKMV